jgi:hypothetical protein
MKGLVVTNKDRGMVEAILAIEDLFPKKLMYGESDIRDNLENKNNMNIIAEDDDGNIIGYALFIPHEDAVKFLRTDDPLMEYNYKKTAYLDQIAVVKDIGVDRYLVFNFLLECLGIEAIKRGYEQWSSHIAIPIDIIIRKKYNGKIFTKKTRQVKMPSYDGIFIYMEGLP